MSVQLFLITPDDADPVTFKATLVACLAATPVDAMLIRRNGRDDRSYRALVEALIPPAQDAGCAVLVENDVALARGLGADGVHVTGSEADVRATITALRPDFIVGAGPAPSRHLDMSLGELGIDYLFFGSLGEPAGADALERAAWWAETFEVPAVLHGTLETDAAGCEFLALGQQFWVLDDPVAALRALDRPVTA